jgi:hypothetical protein
MKKLIVMLLVLTAMLSATIVDSSRARTVAENYYQNYAPTSAKGNVVQKVLTKEYLGQPTWYAVQFTKGFVLVSAEDNVRPILGYSFTSTIDEDLYNMNNPFVRKFSNYDKQIVHDIREQGIERSAMKAEWKNIENKVFPQSSAKATKGPIVETTWGQGYPFDELVPAGAPVGCVATAMHQIMRFHQGPDSGIGANAYTDLSGDITGSHSVDFSIQTYDWSLMQTLNGSVSSQAEVDECSKMAYHLGVSVDMDYNSGGSGSYMTDALTAFQNNWKFTNAKRQYMGTVTDSSLYSATIVGQIDLNQPMEFAGSSVDGGHAYVVDGYNVDAIAGIYQYHFNWGWSGLYDGWFRLDDLTPGTSYFGEAQEFLYDLDVDGLIDQMPEPNNLSGVVDTEGNISLSWDAPTTVVPMGTLIDYLIFRDGVQIGNVGGITRTYTDNVRPEGAYSYVVRAEYTFPDSYVGNSVPSNAWIGSVVADPNYPVPLGMAATSVLYNRSKIDLAWAKPFIGTIYVNDDFESNAHFDLPAGWWQMGSNDAIPPSSWSTLDPAIGLPGFVAIDKAAYPEFVFQGNLSAGANGDGEEFTYTYLLTDASFTLPGGEGVVDYWTKYYAGTEQGVFLYSGTVGGSPNGNIVMLKEYTTGDETWAHDEIDLAPYSGTYRFGFYKLTIGGGSLLCFDNVVLGADTYPLGDQPTGYEIYSNGALDATVGITGLSETYEDNDFDDGLNNYYVRAIYAGSNYSIASNPSSAWMDANPVPSYLEGTYDDGVNESDLSWYSPGHYPLHWFGYEWENDSWNYRSYSTFGTGDVSVNRTYYTAAEFGMAYPVYIEQLASAWYEDVGVEDWVSNSFTIAIGTGTEGSEVYLNTSGNLTAIEDGTWVDYVLPSTLTINEDWFVEVTMGDPASGTPNTMTNVHEEGVDPDQWNSVTYWSGDATNDPGWYAVSYDTPYEFEDFAFLCYGYNDAPTITKTGVAIPRKPVAFTSIKSDKDITLNDVKALGEFQPKTHDQARVLRTDDSKGLQTYQVWRNDARYATTAATTYTDTNPVVGDNTYYITAIYDNPVGESTATNEVVLGPPPVMDVVSSLAETVAEASTKDASFDINNVGLGNLDYTVAYDYVGFATPGETPHSNDFSTFPGTGYTNTGQELFDDGGGTASAIGTRDLESYILTSPQFDTTGLAAVNLSFDQTLFIGGTISDANVEYYDGSGWVSVWSSTVSSTSTVSVPLPSTSAVTQLRFSANLIRVNPDYTETWEIDNILVTSSNVPYSWLSIANPTGTVTGSSTNAINYTCNTAGLTLDSVYVANVTITSNDTTALSTVIPFTLTVGNTGGPIIPAVPANVVTSIVGTDLVIDWDDSADATGYDVYSSDDPYGTFTLVTGVTPSTYTVPASQAKLFYQIIATNATKTAPKTIRVAKSVKSVR